MANEININGAMYAKKGNVDIQRPLPNLEIDWTGNDYAWQSQSIATTATQITIPGSISAGGFAVIQNLDTTNYVEIGLYISSTFYPLMKIKPGKWNLISLGTTTIYAKADTAAVKIDSLILTA